MYLKDLEKKESPKILDYWLKNDIKETVNTSDKIPKKTYNKINLYKNTKEK
jgi:hypothetical protein